MERPISTVLGWQIPPRLLDIGPAALVALQGGLAVAFHQRASAGRDVVLGVGVAVSATALLWRHRSPVPVLAVVAVVFAALGYGPVTTLPVLVALFTVAEYCERPQLTGAAIVSAVVLIGTPPLHGLSEGVASIVSRLVAVALAVAAGSYLRARADYIVGLRERATRLAREHELLSSQAAAEERVRIARELHDVVAHNVSLMVVQAQALAATGAEQGEDQVALTRLADLGREALSEMHRMLGVLRLSNGGEPRRDPQPGVRDIPALIERTRESGLDVALAVTGEPSELAAGVDLSAYRIVQEALTNVIRHAHAATAVVTLAYRPDGFEVTVVDDGAGPRDRPAATGAGHGLVGMRERVSMLGGELEAGDRADGDGYRVHAVLPLGR